MRRWSWRESAVGATSVLCLVLLGGCGATTLGQPRGTAVAVVVEPTFTPIPSPTPLPTATAPPPTATTARPPTPTATRPSPSPTRAVGGAPGGTAVAGGSAPAATGTRLGLNATAPPAASPPRAGTPPTGANYVANFNDWVPSQAGDFERSVDPATGESRTRLLKNNSWSFYAPEEQTFANYVLEADARRISGTDDGEFGLVFGRQPRDPNAQASVRYVFFITSSGDFGLTLINANGQETTVQARTASPAVRRGDAINRLTVTCRGQRVTLAINGQVVGNYTVPETTDGQIGVLVAGVAGTETGFRNLRVAPAP